LTDTFSRYRNRYQNYILKGESSYRYHEVFFTSSKGPKNQIFFQALDTFKLSFKIWVHFEAYKNLHSKRSGENNKKKKFWFRKKNFGSETDTEIGPWFRLPILILNLCLTLKVRQIQDDSLKIMFPPKNERTNLTLLL
jgi:hypothetical protein